MDKQVKNDIKKINRGELPDSLNFGFRQPESIDWQKVKYNSLYKDYSYYEKKFPDGYDSIVGFDKVIKYMADNSLTPLEEINNIIENKVLDNSNEC